MTPPMWQITGLAPLVHDQGAQPSTADLAADSGVSSSPPDFKASSLDQPRPEEISVLDPAWEGATAHRES